MAADRHIADTGTFDQTRSDEAQLCATGSGDSPAYFANEIAQASGAICSNAAELNARLGRVMALLSACSPVAAGQQRFQQLAKRIERARLVDRAAVTDVGAPHAAFDHVVETLVDHVAADA